jgi:hypothetical protein
MAGFGSRPQTQMAIGAKLKTFHVLRPFEWALICSILIAGTQIMLGKAILLGKGS